MDTAVAQTKPVMGRPTVYKPEFAELARAMCKLGATDVDLAEFFGVNVSTVVRWQSTHKDFCTAVKISKNHADDKITRSLYQKAIGYSYDAVKVFMPAGAEEPVYAPYTEHVPPDTTACIFWLKNRRPKEWRDQRNVEVNGELNLNAILGAILEASQDALAAPVVPGDVAVDVTPRVIDVEDEAAPKGDESAPTE
jgi:hypothetical protein